MSRLPPIPTRTYTLFPYTTLFRSLDPQAGSSGLDLRQRHCQHRPISRPCALRDGADKEGGMKVQKHTVQWRLMLWGQWVQEPRTELAQSFSPFGKFAEMQENSNARADGIIYEIIDGDRKSVV